jgi:hypothetical protein
MRDNDDNPDNRHNHGNDTITSGFGFWRANRRAQPSGTTVFPLRCQ